ncbi:MAG: cobalt ECF transporter T component CbiQ [Candidatus Zixiibacteriota bacterium]
MRHNFIDRYSGLGSQIHRLDPRIKFVCMLFFAVSVVTTPPDIFYVYGAYAALVLLLIIVSKVPMTYILGRACLILPFVLMTALFLPFWKTSPDSSSSLIIMGLRLENHRLMLVGSVIIKAFLAALAMILLSSSTPFNSLLKGLQSLKFPRILLMIISFMYRYIFVVTDQAMRMNRARESRACGHNKIGQLRVLTNMIGLLFIRAYERAERVYQSMVSRGFNGEIRSIHELKLSRADYLFTIVFLGSVITIKLMGGL